MTSHYTVTTEYKLYKQSAPFISTWTLIRGMLRILYVKDNTDLFTQ